MTDVRENFRKGEDQVNSEQRSNENKWQELVGRSIPGELLRMGHPGLTGPGQMEQWMGSVMERRGPSELRASDGEERN